MTDAIACQLLVDPPGEGAWNMALDEALLQRAAEEGIATLRFYQWQEPTLSLGYFQKFSERERHPASLPAAVVRRQSGGGAILHDRELTYSISLPERHPFAKDAQLLYNAVHETVAMVLRRYLSHSNHIELFDQVVPLAENEPFLCFERRSQGDIVHFDSGVSAVQNSNHKIVGSAQRRSRGAVLQHGSLLLEKSPLSPELPGLNDFCGTSLTAAGLTDELKVELPLALALNCLSGNIGQNVRSQATCWYNEKYGNGQWTTRR